MDMAAATTKENEMSKQTKTRKIWAGRYETLDGRYTLLRTDYGWHIFAGTECNDDAWVNGAYETKRDALDVIERIAAEEAEEAVEAPATEIQTAEQTARALDAGQAAIAKYDAMNEKLRREREEATAAPAESPAPAERDDFCAEHRSAMCSHPWGTTAAGPAPEIEVGDVVLYQGRNERIVRFADVTEIFTSVYGDVTARLVDQASGREYTASLDWLTSRPGFDINKKPQPRQFCGHCHETTTDYDTVHIFDTDRRFHFCRDNDECQAARRSMAARQEANRRLAGLGQERRSLRGRLALDGNRPELQARLKTVEAEITRLSTALLKRRYDEVEEVAR